ncbi:hypothetical protein [Serratia phage X20]|uniref:Uncharacterized protein n=1 Tax=Serratia phage X20 TaxID=2006942 RepID=A0A1Z1LZC8_9CAUD|nr:hypothetical protein KNT72_gp209 [Serratia phage X20]ARW58179.1 hypothetical protein [Serratia phage X20]
MFVVHNLSNGRNTTRDFGHVNQFFREYPLFRQAKEEPIFKECVEQGFIYIREYERTLFREGNQLLISYHKRLDLLNQEVAYNRNQFGR